MREPLVSFHSPEELRLALWPPHLAAEVNSRSGDLFQPLVDKNLPPLVSIRAMGVILGVNPKLITSMATVSEELLSGFYDAEHGRAGLIICAPRVFSENHSTSTFSGPYWDTTAATAACQRIRKRQEHCEPIRELQ